MFSPITNSVAVVLRSLAALRRAAVKVLGSLKLIDSRSVEGISTPCIETGIEHTTTRGDGAHRHN